MDDELDRIAAEIDRIQRSNNEFEIALHRFYSHCEDMGVTLHDDGTITTRFDTWPHPTPSQN